MSSAATPYFYPRLIGLYTPSSDPSHTLITSIPGLFKSERLSPVPAFIFTSPSSEISNENFWKTLYALWIRRTTSERLPVILSPSLTNETLSDLSLFLTTTGLAYPAPDPSPSLPNTPIATFWSSSSNPDPSSTTESIHTRLILIRSSFWQAAGIPPGLHWLRHPALFPSPHGTTFPPIVSFTNSMSPPILTTHPLRPPKPPPNAILYRRHIISLNSTLTLRHLNPSDPRTFRTYATWQNSDRVNEGWRERGDDEHHKRYLEKMLNDRHSMSVIVEWDGEMAGYAEVAWSLEDGCAAFLRGVEGGSGETPGVWDQGTHYLVGEEKFRGRRRFTAVMVSLKHLCFLRDPRTNIVMGEPRFDLPIIPLLATYLPQEFNREFELPHKRAVYFVLRRERFFQAAILY
ncbi:acyl-CoA N-acyltransferase [Cantharellus anzutake]|uniref:acyl-CoA N-acyltransferase n=1 Tax=Cantharellus anzutake TaxID=1750568 RepID=UPI0019047253|nr:acyl-CoA N-acyltransferase [Cantharellus anzutake]KAF8333032.1 acyl-CoA N-acyltransferase [Cantharellus anzutake]